MSNVVAVISDLIFGTKVTGTGAALGVPVALVSNAERATRQVSDETALVIVDMALANEAAETAIREAKSRGAQHIVAFYSHVETQLAESAQRAGADEVLPRSAFVQRLPQLLQAVAQPE